ncbi:MAG: MBL fold metallo-hydrolase [Verrucomicrobiota bacterium]|nr:MBL fold metallo-hydrolase [Verrucomicrobiota bacterium]
MKSIVTLLFIGFGLFGKNDSSLFAENTVGAPPAPILQPVAPTLVTGTTPTKTLPEGSYYTVEKVAEGVYAVIRKEPPGLIFDCNSIFIINDEDVVVVDTQISPAAARESLAELRKLTTKPVRFVVNTHWHDDHIAGNSVYRDAYPGVEFIAQSTTREDLLTTGKSNRTQTLEGAPGLLDEYRTLLGQNKSFTSNPITEEERTAYLNDIRIAERYIAEGPHFDIVLPTIEVENKLTLQRGSRRIEILYLGRAHTRADLAVYLPQSNLVLSGDLIVYPIPLIGSTSYPLDYGATLERLLALDATTIVPGHGPVMHDDAYARMMQRLLVGIREQAMAAIHRGDSVEDAIKKADLTALRDEFCGDSIQKRFIFANYVKAPGITAAYNQLKEKN